MTNTLQQRIELYIENVARVKAEFKLPHTLVKHMAALLYTGENRRVDGEEIRANFDLIRQNTGLFSAFRSNLSVAIAAMLALHGSPGQQLENSLAVYAMLKKLKFHPCDHLTIAAYEIAQYAEPRRYPEVTGRAREFYVGMRDAHAFLTGEDDYIFAAMLALSDLPVAEGLAHVESLYGRLKSNFSNKNSVQMLSQVLALGNSPEEESHRVLALRDAFRATGLRMDRQYVLSALGVLALLPGTPVEIAETVAEVFNTLRKQPGYGAWSMGRQELLLISSALATYDAMANAGEAINPTVYSNIANIIIAEYTAILVASIAVTTTSTSSSSTGS